MVPVGGIGNESRRGVLVVSTRESGEPGDRLIDQGMPATFQAWIVGATRELGT